MKKRKNTGKWFLTALLAVSLGLALTACAKGEAGQSGQEESGQEESSRESGHEESSRESVADNTAGAAEMNETRTAVMETDQEPEETAGEPVTIYRGNDTVELMLTEEVRLAEITAESLTEKLIEAGVLEKGVKVNSMELTEKDGMTYMDLDFNQEFLGKLNRMGTSGEYFYMGSVVNTFLKAFDAYAVKITADGEPVESGHNIYSEYLHFYRPNPGSIEGKYKFVKSREPIPPTVTLSEDGSFIFQYSLLMSSLPAGTYERTDNKITMKRQGADAVYVFELQGDNLVFNKEESTDTGLEDGAVFEPGY